jgi:hypothetical protein
LLLWCSVPSWAGFLSSDCALGTLCVFVRRRRKTISVPRITALYSLH